MGRHSIKAGAYNNHSFKAQNTGAGGLANLSFQGYVNFGNDTNNPIDTGFGYANAAMGVFTQYLQAERLIEGSMIYNNTEFYVQDNWKASNRLTMDYGIRFTRQQPQYRPVRPDVELLPGPVAGVTGADALRGGLRRQPLRPERGRPAQRLSARDGARPAEHRGRNWHPDSRQRQPEQRHPRGG